MKLGVALLLPGRPRDTLPMVISETADPDCVCGHEALVHGAGGCLVGAFDPDCPCRAYRPIEYVVSSPLCGPVAMSSRAGAMAVTREVASRMPGHWVSLWSGDDVQHYRAKRDGRFVRAKAPAKAALGKP